MHKDSFLSQMQERSHEELYEIAHFGSEDVLCRKLSKHQRKSSPHVH